MRRALAFAALLAATPAAAEQDLARAEKGSVELLQPIRGAVVPSEQFLLPSPFEGRIEALPVPAQTRFSAKQEMAIISPTDMAALIDSNLTTPSDILQDRWRKVFKLQRVRAPWDGYLLEVKAAMKARVIEDQPLFLITRDLLIEPVLPVDRLGSVRVGMPVSLWLPSTPNERMPGKLLKVLTDVPEKGIATLRIQLVPEEGKALPPPGTLLEGALQADVRRNVTVLPARAVQRSFGRSFACVEIEEGLSDGVRTEIQAGIEPGRVVLLP